jgi:hypothetical protein
MVPLRPPVTCSHLWALLCNLNRPHPWRSFADTPPPLSQGSQGEVNTPSLWRGKVGMGGRRTGPTPTRTILHQGAGEVFAGDGHDIAPHVSSPRRSGEG